MKKKKSKSKKSKKNAKGGGDGGYGGDSDEMNEDDNDYPVVDIVAEDMPEGALESDEDDRRLRDLNDPHRLLNFDDLEAAMLVLSMTHCKFRHSLSRHNALPRYQPKVNLHKRYDWYMDIHLFSSSSIRAHLNWL